jgi:hypothetical protein
VIRFVKVRHVDDCYVVGTYAAFGDGGNRTVTRELRETYPYTFYVGHLTQSDFTKYLSWIRSNCTGMVVHNFPDVYFRKRHFRDDTVWHTTLGFSDPSSAMHYKLVFGNSLSTVGIM